MAKRKITLTLSQNPSTHSKEYTIEKVTNSVEWTVGDDISKQTVSSLLRRQEVTVNIVKRK